MKFFIAFCLMAIVGGTLSFALANTLCQYFLNEPANLIDGAVPLILVSGLFASLVSGPRGAENTRN